MSDNASKIEEGLEVKSGQEVKSPPMYRVLILNDDYTTMEFVVQVLEAVFRRPPAEATQIMLHVHKRGVGLCGVYTRDIAETKVKMVHELAQGRGFPLRCITEKE